MGKMSTLEGNKFHKFSEFQPIPNRFQMILFNNYVPLLCIAIHLANAFLKWLWPRRKVDYTDGPSRKENAFWDTYSYEMSQLKKDSI